MNLGAIALIFAALLAAPARAQTLPNGKAVYDSNCAACHSSGAAGAPRTGDVSAWSARVATGIEALYANAVKGKGAMPPKGGNTSLTEAQVRAAVDHMVGLSVSNEGAAGARRAGARQPDARSAGAPEPSKATSTDTAKGKLVYQTSCAACHTSGLSGSPKLGDGVAWAPRTAGGTAALYRAAIKGKGAMPAKGGNASLPDAEVRAAVDFMLAQLPARPAAATAARDNSDPNAFNRLMIAPDKRNSSPMEDSIHDAESPGTPLLQAPALSFRSLPRSNIGNYVNWVAALGKKQIRPRWDAQDPKAEPMVMDLTIVREVKGSMPDVVFPHKQHTEWLDCSNCHPAIFTPQKGANQISMAAIMLGQKCGVCHGKVAFPVSECRLCHARQKNAVARTVGPPQRGGGSR